MIKIDELIGEARKNKQESRLSVLQAIKAAFQNYKTAKNAKPLDDTAEIQIIKKMVSQREESIMLFRKGGREDLATSEETELDILKEFLPAEVGRDEIMAVLEEWMKTNTLEKKTMGLAIKYVKSKLPMADGKLTSDIVKEKIG